MLKSNGRRGPRMRGKLQDADIQCTRDGGLILDLPASGARVGLDRLAPGTRTNREPVPVDYSRGTSFSTPDFAPVTPSAAPAPTDEPQHVPGGVSDAKDGAFGGGVAKKEKSVFPWLLLAVAVGFALTGIKK